MWRIVSKTPEGWTDSAEHATEPGENRVSSPDEPGAESGGTLPDYDPSALCSQRHFLTELDLHPDEFVSRLLEDQGGTLRQKEFTEFTDLSSSTISRLLQEMEDDGEVVRVQVGRENIVYLPEHAPSDDVDSTDDSLRV